MTIEFDVPTPIDAANGPVSVFNRAFGAYDLGDAGRSLLTDATINAYSMSTRPPTAMELQKIKKSEDMADRTQGVAEYRKVIIEMIGKHTEFGMQTDAHRWPEEVTFYLLAAPTRSKYGRINKSHCIFKFTKGGTLLLTKPAMPSASPNNLFLSWGKLAETVETVRLADPDCFEKVRNFTGLRP
jgi:hypothetical protein